MLVAGHRHRDSDSADGGAVRIGVSLQEGNIVHQLGADSLLGAAGGLGVIQQGAPMASGVLLGGAGTATIADDPGARRIR